MQNVGESTVPTKTEEGTVRDITFQNVKLDPPILSTHEMTSDGSFLIMGHDQGFHLDPRDGACDKFISHADVYFQNIFVPRSLTSKQQLFSRPGVV